VGVVQHAFQTPGDHVVRLRVRGGPFDDFDDAEAVVAVQPAVDALSALTVAKAGLGAGSIRSDPRGVIECAAGCPGAGPLLLAPASTIVLTASPEPGSALAGWSGCDSVSGDRCTVTMTADRAVAATFVPLSGPFTLTVALSQPPGSIGSIIAVGPPGNVISCGLTSLPVCSQAFPAGTVVVIRPSDTSVELGLFAGWTGCDSIGGLFACTVTLTGDRTVTATFAR
jgi:hypothetical protein